ncbi:MAG: hypothetical protein AAF596_03690 [Planctomycetota bacterium]
MSCQPDALPCRQASPLRRRRPLAVVPLAVAWLVVGCGARIDPQDTLIRGFADAAGAKASPSVDLRDAIAAVEQANGLPDQLVRSEIAPADNAAVLLADQFNDLLRSALVAPVERWLDRERFRFDAEELTRIERLVDRHADRIKQLVAAAERPDARFPIAAGYGFFASTAYLDDAAIACRFELLTAALRLNEGSVAGATAPLARAAKWIGWLSVEPRLEPRLMAARLRGEWLRAVEAIAEHPSASLADYETLRRVLVEWLDAWPDDARAIAGDRAATVHAYEAIRAGLLDDLATDDERFRLQERGVVVDQPLASEIVDADQLAYLRSVGKVIALDRRPYFERADRQQTVSDLLMGAGADDGAPLAEELFLPGLPTALETFAIDRAGCELWALALSSAGGFRLPPQRVNPHSGEPYQVERLPRSLLVRSNDPDLRDAFALVRSE